MTAIKKIKATANDASKPTAAELQAVVTGTLPLFDVKKSCATRYMLTVLPATQIRRNLAA